VEAISNCDIMQVTVFPRVEWKFGPGQHTFLYLPGLGKFWENHPFSIADWKGKGQTLPTISSYPSVSDSIEVREETKAAGVVAVATDSDSQSNSTAREQQARTPSQSQVADRPCIQFLIRAHSGMTSTLQRRLLSSPDRSSMEMSIYTEGPYAGH
jgi:FAD-binding domain